MNDSYTRAYLIGLSLVGLLITIVQLNLGARITRVESRQTVIEMRLDVLEMEEQEQTIEYYDDLRERDVR